MNGKLPKENSDITSAEDAFWLTDLYPDAEGLFTHEHASLSDVADNCIVVLDANVLLLPFEFSSESVSAIRKVYTELTDANRLVIPAQAAREFYKNRSRKIALIADAIDGAITKAKKPILEKSIPILENDPDYLKVSKIDKELKKNRDDIVNNLTKINRKLKDDIGTDPVSKMYRELFKGCVCHFIMEDDDKKINKEQKNINYSFKNRISVVKEVARRARLQIAPGYHDQKKEDGGIGDLLIWLTILQEANNRKTNCIFVTEEEKADWWIRRHGTFQPRPELIDEYRRASEGKSLHLLPLSGLLSKFNAEQKVIKQVQDLEKEQKEILIKDDKISFSTESVNINNNIKEEKIKDLLIEINKTQDKIYNIIDHKDSLIERNSCGEMSDKVLSRNLKMCNISIEDLKIVRKNAIKELEFLKGSKY